MSRTRCIFLSFVQLISHSNLFTDEDQFARIYDHGKIIARMYRDIAEALLSDHYLGGSFEDWWKNKLSEEVRKDYLLIGLLEANSRTGGVKAIHRLLCVLTSFSLFTFKLETAQNNCASFACD